MLGKVFSLAKWVVCHWAVSMGQQYSDRVLWLQMNWRLPYLGRRTSSGNWFFSKIAYFSSGFINSSSGVKCTVYRDGWALRMDECLSGRGDYHFCSPPLRQTLFPQLPFISAYLKRTNGLKFLKLYFLSLYFVQQTKAFGFAHLFIYKDSLYVA